MSISSAANRNTYTGNGTVDTYSYTFRIFKDTHLLVTVKDTSGVESTLTLGTDYTVSGVGENSGGTIALVNSSQSWLEVDGDLKTGYLITIRRVVPTVQETDIRNQGDFFPEVHEDAFDYLTMIDQQQQDELDRSVKLAETVSPSTFNPALPTDIALASRAIVTNPDGDGFAMGPTVDEISNAQSYALAAQASAAAALASENAAQSSEDDAETAQVAAEAAQAAAETAQAAAELAETNAETAETNAETAETNAEAAAVAAAASAAAALVSQGAAATSASNAATSETNAATSEGNAATSETNSSASAASAAASAAAAANNAAASHWNDVVYKVFADSPISIVQADSAKLFSIDCTGGNVTVNLPLISGLNLTGPWAVGFVKTDTTDNKVIINRDGTDTVNAATSFEISVTDQGVVLVPDTDPSPDRWEVLKFGTTDFLRSQMFNELVSDPASPPAGKRTVFARPDGFYEKTSAGAVSKLGTGSGGGGIEYILNPDAENGTTGWVGYADAAGVTPVDGTGGASSIVFTSSATGPLRKTRSFLWTKDAVNRQGHGESYDFTIDEADRFKVLQGSIEYAIASGTYADNDLAIYIYDVTNSQLIQPTPFQIKNHSLPAERLGFEFQATGSISYRLIIHTASTSALAYSLKFDSFSVGPRAKLYGSPVLDWSTSSTTLTNFGNATASAIIKKTGDTASFKIRIQIGSTAPTGNLAFSLPPGLSLDYFKTQLGSGGANLGSLGKAEAFRNSTAATFIGGVFVVPGSTNTFNITGGNGQVLWTPTNPQTFSNATFDTIFIEMNDVPILGWSSSVVMSNDANTRVVAARASLTAAQTAVASKVIPFNAVSLDTHGAFNSTTGVYTILVPGSYAVSAGALYSSLDGTTDTRVQIRKNGSVVADSYMSRLASGSTSTAYGTVSDIVTGVAGDTIDIFASGDASFDMDSGGLRTFVSIQKISGPAQIAASESINFSAYTAAAPSITSAQDVVFGTKDFDSHGAYNATTGVFTAPIAGRYRFSTHLQFVVTAHSTTQGIQLDLMKNASVATTTIIFGNGASSPKVVQVTKTLMLLAGDTVKVRAASDIASSLSATGGRSYFEGSFIGNY